jgi:DNA-binding beta-propeller fold protein YncE
VLYSVAIDGDMFRLVTIDTATGLVTQVGIPQLSPFGSPYGVDFDPVADSLSVVGGNDELYGIDPDTGVGVLVSGFTYGTAESPSIAHIAYTNSTAGATTTVLYSMDWVLETLAASGTWPPNTGFLTAVGPLGRGMLGAGGFDIEPDTNAAYVALQRDITYSSLYSVDLATGEATEIGSIGGGRLAGIAIAPEPSAVASSLCAVALIQILRSIREFRVRARLRGVVAARAAPGNGA